MWFVKWIWNFVKKSGYLFPGSHNRVNHLPLQVEDIFVRVAQLALSNLYGTLYTFLVQDTLNMRNSNRSHEKGIYNWENSPLVQSALGFQFSPACVGRY